MMATVVSPLPEPGPRRRPRQAAIARVNLVSRRDTGGKPFTEPVLGIHKGKRHTEWCGRALLRGCERYSHLSQLREHGHEDGGTSARA